MKDGDDQRGVFRGALPASLAAHLLIAALLIFGLPLSLLQPEEEQPIKVELVPPPEAPKKAKAKPPPPPPPQEKPKPEEKKAETPPPASKPPPPVALAPVDQFGEKDAGPRKAEGDSATEGSASPEAESEPDKPEPEQPPTETAAAATPPTSTQGAPVAPAGKPADAKPKKAAKPEEGKKLASREATGDVLATTAMGDLPRGVRGGRLCVTELRDQMRNSLPPYFPDLLPSYRLEEGTVIVDVPKAAFRVSGVWYDLSYRCQVDKNATKVVGFDFRVGNRLSPDEQERRGLPLQ